ncbi:hypothetical protein SAMN03097708_01470 [Thiohalomonas denitrificans]|uniref:DUF378 domain-containing protein n=2 Tax=Thiohalomonas denitrificans TaxID=415747 RepID=A0A1G5Q6Y0_9GAMM|nr:DUF378 domain-containing protein [Thiohalomonas denitrificans]SCZ57635.1 hypothetical protein SAMN03097708_01470 [Thiohalomonas denitrificans]
MAKMAKFNTWDWVALVLLIVGGLNWGLIGIFGFDLVAAIFGEMSFLSRLVYTLVGLSAVYIAIEAIRWGRTKEAVEA